MTTPADDYEPVHVLTDSALKATIRQAKAEAWDERDASNTDINPYRASRIEAGE